MRLMPKRQLSVEEKIAVNEAIRRHMDEMFQWTQFKMSLRLWKDEEGIDKEGRGDERLERHRP